MTTQEEKFIADVNAFRTSERENVLKKISKSKRRYGVRVVKSLPSGDRNMRQILDKPYYEVIERPVDATGTKNDFYGTKAKVVNHYTSKDLAEAIVWKWNYDFHGAYCATGNKHAPRSAAL